MDTNVKEILREAVFKETLFQELTRRKHKKLDMNKKHSVLETLKTGRRET